MVPFNFTKKRGAYNFGLKKNIGKRIYEMKKEAKNEKEQRGIISRAVREQFPDLKNANYNSPAFEAALQVARRAYQKYINPSDEEVPARSLKSTFRQPGKTGPKVKAPEVRDGLYEWIVDIRTAVKARIPRALLRAKAAEIQNTWILENPEASIEYEKVYSHTFY